MSEPLPTAVPTAVSTQTVLAAATMQQRAVQAVRDSRRSLTGFVPQLQYRLTRLGWSGLGGIAALIAAGVVAITLLLPAHQSVVAMRAELSKAAAPFAHRSASFSGDSLIATLPTRMQIPAVLGQVIAQANKAGVALDEGRYSYSPPKAGTLGRYAFEFPVSAPYPAVRDFIDRTLIAVPAVGLDKLRIERKKIGDTAINAEIGFVVFVRGE